MIRSHVVVDGSNIATEGRTTPSLRQLDEAVKAFLAEHDVETLTVVVDATFPNRIDPSERAEYEEALLAGELVTPPAGAIGRGDAFILQIAEKVDATVLSNDSFQEFHAARPWLFDEGRLIGGKPVPGRRLGVPAPHARPRTRQPHGRRPRSRAKGKDRSRPDSATAPRLRGGIVGRRPSPPQRPQAGRRANARRVDRSPSRQPAESSKCTDAPKAC